ncbi:class I SAM-dependent methyltransferase [Flavisolibacter sp. BT320]|nr:class I SAM-dependent methyltransferase [Flavisolibacter longurius]
MNKNNRLTTREFWTTPNPGFAFERHRDHAIERLIKKFIPATNNGECIEIGSYPGPFLAAFGDLGYTLHGVDFHPRNEDELPEWLRSQGFQIGKFVTEDFFTFKTKKRFDIVASFGFLEHFEDYKDVISRHAALVKENGYLVLTTPNFRGWVQRWLHRTFDQENLTFHNLESMRPNEWALLLESLGFEIIFKGHVGGFIFWRANDPLTSFRRKAHWLISRMIPRINKLLWFDSPGFSGYCGVVAKKRNSKA